MAFLKYGDSMKYYYKIADILIQIDIPISIRMQEESECFLVNDKDSEPDVRIQFVAEDDMPYEKDNVQFSSDVTIYTLNDKYVLEYFLQSRDNPYAWLVKEAASLYRCHYLKGYHSQFAYSLAMLNLISLEQILLDFEAMILHCSFVRWNGHGILFTGPSGIGKSTQASLWKQYENAEILNGDRAAIRNMDGRWRAYGIPFAGSSGIYRNESADLSVIVILKQGKENRIRKISNIEAFKNIYKETTSHKWNRDFQNKIMDLISNLVESVQIYELECRPDGEAVEILKKEFYDGTKTS